MRAQNLFRKKQGGTKRPKKEKKNGNDNNICAFNALIPKMFRVRT